MGSSLDLLGSYIIGGLVLILMTAVILNFQEGTNETLLNEISQVSLAQMSQTMDKEINNLGYRVSGPEKVLSVDYRSIAFLSDIDNNGVVDTISYRMDRTKNGPVVTRRISSPDLGARSWTTRGAMVLFSAFDSTGAQTTDPSLVRAVEASMLTSNVLYERIGSLTAVSGTSTGSEGVGGAGTKALQVSHEQLLATAIDVQAGAYWHKTIYPRNLSTVPPQIAGAAPPTGSEGSAGSGSTVGSPSTVTTGGTEIAESGGMTSGSESGGTQAGGSSATAGSSSGNTSGEIDLPGSQTGDETPAPNDPCPCGSGKKYKQCCGK